MVRGYPECLCSCRLMRECLDVYGTLELAGRYANLCVGAMVNCAFACLSVWSPRPTLWEDEMRLGPWPAEDEDDGLPRRDEDSPWCECTVTSSEGALTYFYAVINSL